MWKIDVDEHYDDKNHFFNQLINIKKLIFYLEIKVNFWNQAMKMNLLSSIILLSNKLKTLPNRFKIIQEFFLIQLN